MNVDTLLVLCMGAYNGHGKLFLISCFHFVVFLLYIKKENREETEKVCVIFIILLFLPVWLLYLFFYITFSNSRESVSSA